MPRDIQENDVDQKNDTRELYRQEFDALDSRKKGSWGERAVIKEADDLGHVILLDHWDAPNLHGFDCVSYDPERGELHIWEAKNWNGKLSERDLTAWQDITQHGEPRKGFRDSWCEIIRSIPEGPVRNSVKDAINEGRVYYHLRTGPETEITAKLEERLLNDASVPGANYDYKKYSHDYMRNIGA